MSHKRITTLNPQYDDVAHPTLQHATASVIDFLSSLRTENGHRINTPEAKGDKTAVLNKRSLEKLLASHYVCYKAAINTEISRRNALVGGLAGGTIIGVSIYGLVSYIRRRRIERRSDSD